MVKKWIITAATFGGKKIASLHEKKKEKKICISAFSNTTVNQLI